SLCFFYFIILSSSTEIYTLSLHDALPICSFTLTRTRLCLCITRDPPRIECASTIGVDRNFRNLTVGNDNQTQHYDLSKSVRIAKDRKSTRLNSSHVKISYAVFCLKKKIIK